MKFLKFTNSDHLTDFDETPFPHYQPNANNWSQVDSIF